MDWNDTIGQNIQAKMISKALEVKPLSDIDSLRGSIKRSSITVGITRECIADVVDAEIEAMIGYRSMGDYSITNDFLAGMLAVADLIRSGTHVMDNL